MKAFLSFSSQNRKKSCFTAVKVSFSQEIILYVAKDFGWALVLFNSVQCDRRKLVIIFISEQFSEMGAGIEKGYTSLGYGLMEVRAYFEQEIQSNIYCNQLDSLQ